jgi:mono/diheme cytochrome c family protein
MNQTLFYVFGIALAISAVATSFIGLKVENFPGKAMPLVIGWFAILIIGAGTFAVLNGKDEDKDHAVEYSQANKEIEKNTSSGPFEGGEEGEEGANGVEGAETSEGEESSESTEGPEAEEEAGENSTGEGGEEPNGEATGGGGNPEAGESVFAENCSVCHGTDGHGGSGGPDLRTMPLAKTEEGAIGQVTNGGGGMPAFQGQLSPEEIEDVASYVVEDVVGGN